MKTTIITLAGKKGGTGKSTLCLAVAATLALRGKKVLVVDTDPQASALSGARAAPDDSPFPATVIGLAGAGSKLARELHPHVGVYDYILVDTQAGTSFEATQSALLVSNLCLLPSRPSAPDIFALRSMQPLLDQVRTLNEALVIVVVATQVPRTSAAGHALDVLKQLGHPVLDALIRDRSAYQELAMSGLPLQRLGRGAKLAAAEVESLTDELLKIIK